MVCWLNSDHGNLTLDEKKHQFAGCHSDPTPVQTCCAAYSVRPLRQKLQKTSREKKAADRESIVCRLVFKKNKKTQRRRRDLVWLFCTSSHSQTSLSGDVKLVIAWGELELANARAGTNYQACEQNCPNLTCAQWLQQQVPQTGEEGGGGQHAKCI